MAKGKLATGSRHKADNNPEAAQSAAQPFRLRVDNSELLKAKATLRGIRARVRRLKQAEAVSPADLATFTKAVFRAVGE